MNIRLLIVVLLCLGVTACSTQPQRPATSTSVPACANCGRVERLELVPVTANASGQGAVLSGVVGGVVSKPAAPGAAPPAASKSYRVGIRMDDGRRMVLTQKVISASLKIGSRVRLEGTRIVLLP